MRKNGKLSLSVGAVAGAALTGLLVGSASAQPVGSSINGLGSPKSANAAIVQYAGASDISVDPAKHECKGQNACKGQGGCNSGDNGCKGKNSCKGKGGCNTTH